MAHELHQIAWARLEKQLRAHSADISAEMPIFRQFVSQSHTHMASTIERLRWADSPALGGAKIKNGIEQPKERALFSSNPEKANPRASEETRDRPPKLQRRRSRRSSSNASNNGTRTLRRQCQRRKNESAHVEYRDLRQNQDEEDVVVMRRIGLRDCPYGGKAENIRVPTEVGTTKCAASSSSKL